MRVLITGGSGFIGREVVRQLQATNTTVRVLARGIRPQLFGVETCPGSVLEPDTLPPAMKDCDAVIHLVGIITETGNQTYERVHTEGTANVLISMRAMGISTLVHMSALGTRPDAKARYHQSKWAAEELVRNSGSAWTIHRPSLVYGPGDGFVNLFAQISRWSPILPLLGSHSLVQPISVEDVARCFVESLTRDICKNKTYDLCGSTRFTYRELIQEILRATGRRRLCLPVPLALAKLPAWVGERTVPLLTGKGPPLNTDQLLMLAENNVGDVEAMRRDFEFDPIRFEDGIRRWLAPGSIRQSQTK